MIITSLLDNDLYKFTMQQFAFHKNPKLLVKYKLIIRGKEDIRLYAKEIEKEIHSYLRLRFNENDLSYLKSLNIFQEDYLSYLKNLKFESIKINLELKDNLELEFSGIWSEAILLEVPFLAVIQEVVQKNNKYDSHNEETRMYKKAEIITNNKFKVIEMGTRRRFSKDWQEKVIKILSSSDSFLGTSNVFFAKKLGLKPFGTMAHEFFQAHQGLYPLEESERVAMRRWKEEYGNNLNVVLTDIFNVDKFIEDYKASGVTYNGFRQDSGDPIKWGEKIIKLMNQIGQKDYQLLFSDSLDLKKMEHIQKHFQQLYPIFGVGTFLTNDLTNIKSLNLVIKMIESNGKGTIKISDEPNKLTCFSKETELEAYQLNLIKKGETL